MFAKKPNDNKRSKQWPKVRRQYIAHHPVCEICRCRKGLNVHHKKPFHLFPELELEPSNFITLCEHLEHSCHWIFGHLYDYKSFNKDIVEDAEAWNKKILSRPV